MGLEVSVAVPANLREVAKQVFTAEACLPTDLQLYVHGAHCSKS